MRSLSAVLQMIDGKSLRVIVPDPPPDSFTMAAHPGPNRVLRLTRHGPLVTYVEADRRKTALPVRVERRQ
jgi:hypothetical protein